MKHFKFGKGSLENLQGVSEDLIAICDLALEISEYDFSIISGYRTAEQQNKMYLDSLSSCDGYQILSAHQKGLAVDILPYVIEDNGSMLDCWNYNNPKVQVAWLEVYRAFLTAARRMSIQIELGLTYNIDGGYDYPHIEIKE